MGWSEVGESLPIVGREPQIKLVEASLLTLWQEKYHEPTPLLLYFYGMRGIGKTRLLESVAAKVQSELPGPGFLSLFINSSTSLPRLSENAQFRPLEEIDAFFNEFYRQFKLAGQPTQPSYNLAEYERLLLNRSYLKNEDGLWLRARTLAGDLARLHREQGLRLLILQDNVPSKVFQWLSKFFYKDLLIEGVLAVVATGYSPPVVSTLSLLAYFKSLPLQALQAEEARQLLGAGKLPFAVENELIEMAAGHPASLLEGWHEIVAMQLKNQDAPAFFDESGDFTLAGQARLAKVMAEALLQNIPSVLARCCRLIAPLRLFRYDTLAAFLPPLMPEEAKYGRASVVDFMLLGKELNDQIDFIASDKAYIMHPLARTILSNETRFTQPEKFRQLNEAAANYYGRLIERLEKPEQRSEAILEELYHRLLLAHFTVGLEQETVTSVSYEAIRTLQQHLPRLVGREDKRRLISLLQRDPDFGRLFPNETAGLLQLLDEV